MSLVRSGCVPGSGCAGFLLVACAMLIATTSCDSSSSPVIEGKAGLLSPDELDRTLRVLIAPNLPGCRITSERPIEFVNPSTGQRLWSGPAARGVDVSFSPGQVLFPGLALQNPLSVIDIRATGNAVLTLSAEGRPTRQYPEVLRLVVREDGSGDVINVVDVEAYLPGVLSAEMMPNFHREAFEAQAIAARTYAWYQRQTRGPSRHYDVTATESSQVYLGVDPAALLPKAIEAVRQTRGIVCTYHTPDGPRIFPTYYSSTCGGSTQPVCTISEPEPIPPLAGCVDCEFCRHSPYRRWDAVRLDKSVVAQKLIDRYPRLAEIGSLHRVVVSRGTDAGRAVWVELQNERGHALPLEAENFRLCVDPTGRKVRSTYCNVVSLDHRIVFTEGRGLGHGMGLCQYGADGQARAGRSAAQILRHYFPGSQLTRAY